jgi:hypothetical protein
MWNIERSLDALIRKFRRQAHDPGAEAPQRLFERPSRDDVLQTFRLILGRELKDEDAIRAHMSIATVADLRLAVLNSPEFQGKYKLINPDAGVHPDLTMERQATVFIHLQKTGGTSLRAFLERQFPADRVCPIRDDRLHLLSVAELGRYDFFSGHFDRSTLRFIPRANIKTIAVFREPRARLISFYRFLKSHPVRDEFADDPFMRLANEVSAEEFFERPETRNLPAVYNHYLIALCGSFNRFRNDPISEKSKIGPDMIENAKQQIRALTAIGITERFDASVEQICSSLGLLPPSSIPAVHVTDEFAKSDTRFKRVDPVVMTPRLAAALKELTRFDEEIYRYAIEEFERRRCASIGAPSAQRL